LFTQGICSTTASQVFFESKLSIACIKLGKEKRLHGMKMSRFPLLVLVFALILAQRSSLPSAEADTPNGLPAALAQPEGGAPAPPLTTQGSPSRTKSMRDSKTDPITILLIVFGCPVAIVALVAYFRARKQKMLHETLRAIVEKGLPIPPELLHSSRHEGNSAASGQDDPDTALRQGLLLVAAGLGICIWLLIKSSDSWGLGFIPLLIGVSFLVEWLIAKRKSSKPE
jgi:lipid-A-disaccharide synthase-like uncharacterized protein